MSVHGFPSSSAAPSPLSSSSASASVSTSSSASVSYLFDDSPDHHPVLSWRLPLILQHFTLLHNRPAGQLWKPQFVFKLQKQIKILFLSQILNHKHSSKYSARWLVLDRQRMSNSEKSKLSKWRNTGTGHGNQWEGQGTTLTSKLQNDGSTLKCPSSLLITIYVHSSHH